MKIMLEALDKGETGGPTKCHEVSVEHLLWLRLELSSGHEVTIREITGPVEKGTRLSMRCITGRLRVEPESSNAVVLEAVDF